MLSRNTRRSTLKHSVVNMTTKELRKKLKIAQLPAGGSRKELEDRYNEFRKSALAGAGMSPSDDDDQQEDVKDDVNPAIVMLDEETGNKYFRIVDQKGLGTNGEMKRLILDMHEELKAWGRPGVRTKT